MKKVLITSRSLNGEDEMTYNRVPAFYVEAVRKAGAIPLIAGTEADDKVIEEYVNLADAIIFSGGEDINPKYYGEDISFQVKYISSTRDIFEEKLFAKALEHQIPLLGICRGMQMISALMGGKLYQDIEKDSKGTINHGIKCGMNDYVHSIQIEKDSILGKLFGEQTMVNSFHHQAVSKEPNHFKITARASDGIIEALEYMGDSYIHLVQFHPEALVDKDKRFLEVFKDLIQQA